MSDWLGANDHVHIATNVAPEVLGRGGLQYAAMKSGLMKQADKIVIEITERGLPDETTLGALRLATNNLKFAIDDFGTGHAQIERLSEMDVDIIKIDKSFVDKITAEKKCPKLIKGLAAFAKAMDMEVIAEGVESELQARTPTELGIVMSQGWYFSRPLKADAFRDFHRRHMRYPSRAVSM